MRYSGVPFYALDNVDASALTASVIAPYHHGDDDLPVVGVARAAGQAQHPVIVA